MRILLAGGSGFIGSALRLGPIGDHHEVVSLVRQPTDAPNAVLWNAPRRQVDHSALEEVGPIDAVINLSGAGIGDHRWNQKVKGEILASRLAATSYLAELVATLHPVPSVFISASAIGFYGDRGESTLTEKSEPGQGFLADVCQQWEAAAAPAFESTRTVLLRTGVVLSGSGGSLAKQLPLFRWGVGGRLGSGHQYVSWISMTDHLSIVEKILSDDRLSGPINSTAPHPVTNVEFTSTLAEALHRPHIFAVPESALRLALGRDMANELLLSSARVLPTRMNEAGHSFMHPRLAEALTNVV
jgi:uncharacterized protein